MKERVDELLNKLGNSISSAAAKSFEFQIRHGEILSGKRFLKDYFNDEESDLIINYYIDEYNSKKELIEILDYSELKPFDKILVNYGGEIFKSYIEDGTTYARLKESSFYSPSDSYVSVSKAIQIWKINKK